MEPTNSHKVKLDTSNQPRPLTQSEKESLRQDMKASSDWARTELKRRREQREALPRQA